MAKSLGSLSLVSLMALVNNGATTESICSDFSCTEQEFRARLSEICTRKGTIDSVLGDIARNEKKAGVSKPAEKPSASKGFASPFTASSSTSSRSAASSSRAASKVSSPEVDSLVSKEAELSMKLTTLESQSNDLLNKHYANTKELRDLEKAVEAASDAFEVASNALEAARAAFEKQKGLYDNCAATDKRLAEEIANVKASQEMTQKEIEETRQQILELTRATIRVHADGSFTQVSGKSPVSFDESGSDALFAELSEKEEYEDLPVKKLRILSKLVKVVEHCNLELTVECEDDDVDRAFRKVGAR